MPDRKKLGKRSKVKGRAWEQAVVRLLKPIFGDKVHRGHQDSRGGAAAGEGCDVEGTPFWCETKHGKAVSPMAALRQCREAQLARADTRPPVVVVKDDRKPPEWKVGKPLSPPMVVMELSDWLDLVGDWAELKSDAGEKVVVWRKERNLR
jgi:hypothetical protein